jgi:iron complex outermembrane receptor protein
LFHRRERDGIDYIRTAPSEIWRAANFRRLSFTGLETAVEAAVAREHRVELRYTGLRGVQRAAAGVMSRYTFNYPIHSGLAAWQGVLPHGLLGRSRIGVFRRFGRAPYVVWDVWLASSRGRLRPFIQFTNLTGARYEEVIGVPMPGRGVLVGVQFVR